MGLKPCSLSKIWAAPFSANLKWTAVCCRVKQVSVWGRKNRTEKIHLRTFLALSLAIPLKNRYPVCRDSWDPGAGSSHPAMQSALHYTQKDVGKKTQLVFMLENHVKYFVRAKSKWHPRNIYTRWRSYQAVLSEGDHGVTSFTVKHS